MEEENYLKRMENRGGTIFQGIDKGSKEKEGREIVKRKGEQGLASRPGMKEEAIWKRGEGKKREKGNGESEPEGMGKSVWERST